MTTTPDLTAGLKQAVTVSIEDLRLAYPERVARVVPDGSGGAWVELVDVAMGDAYEQELTFLIFLLPFNLPGSDIYPMFVRDDLRRLDGQPLGEGMQLAALSWPGEAEPRPVVQISRRTRGDFATQSASQKVEKVLQWLRTR